MGVSVVMSPRAGAHGPSTEPSVAGRRPASAWRQTRLHPRRIHRSPDATAGAAPYRQRLTGARGALSWRCLWASEKMKQERGAEQRPSCAKCTTCGDRDQQTGRRWKRLVDLM